MAYCKECGAELAEGLKFCEACGTPVPQGKITGERCPACGNEKQEGEKFCSECGYSYTGEAPPVEEQKVEPQETPAAVITASTYSPAAQAVQAPKKDKRKTGILIIAAAVALLMIAGIAVGLALFLNHQANQNAIKEAEEQAIEALEAAEDIDGVEEEILESIRNLSLAEGLDQMKGELNTIQKDLEEASSKMQASAAGLEKVPVKRLPDWRRQYIELLQKAANEEVAALNELSNLISRMLEITDFIAVYESGVTAYADALNTLNQAVNQHDAEDYAGAKATAAQVSALLAQAKQDIEKAAEMEPESGVGDLLGTISNLEVWMNGFNQVCDLGASGQIAAHDQMVDQLRPQYQGIPSTIGIDINAWIDGERNNYLAEIEKHLDKASKYRRQAAALLKKYQ